MLRTNIIANHLSGVSVCVCVAGNQSSPGSGAGSGQESRESTLERRRSEVNPDKRGGTPEPNRRKDTRSGSVSSVNRWELRG